ncbi:MAG: hypothetical protein PV354_00150, partial [Bartonella sp.]|nr:hypothetical protein [Bartonella sp.]
MITADEYTHQTIDGVTMGNIIRALKTMNDIDWTAWFETVSCVDFILRENSDFSEIDSYSRNAYRQVIEKIAHRSPLSELEIACKAVEMAKTCSQDVACKNNFSVGWYLVDDGRSIFEEVCGYNPSFLTKWIQTYYRLKIGIIAIPVSLLTLVLLSTIYISLRTSGLTPLMTLLFTALALFPTMDA